MEDVGRLLDIRDAAFPEQVQNVHLADGDVPQPPGLAGVPEHAVDAGAGLQLVVVDLVIHLLEVGLLQHHREDGAKKLGLPPVPLLPGQDIGAGIIVHHVGVLVGDGVEKPAGGRLHLILSVAPHTLPVAQLVPLLVVHHPAFQIGLALLISVQDGLGLLNFLPADGRFKLLLIH